jgi:hypothetical protein
MSNLKNVAEEFLQQDDAESSVGDFFELTEIRKRNGEFDLWNAPTPIHAQQIQREEVYQAPYSIIKNYQRIEKRLDKILPVNLEDTLIYQTIRTPKAQPLSCEITD